jgi:predicted P-loop ATPase
MAHQTKSLEAKIAITVFSKTGGPLTKKISLAKDGSVHSDGSACVMSKGEAERVGVNNVEELATLIGKLHSYQAIALGTLRDDLPDHVEIVSKTKLNGDAPNVITRTRDNIVYRANQPAPALIDFDRKGMPDDMSQRIGASFWDTLVEVLPALAGAARVMRRSTSAGLYRGDTELPSSGGWHAYIVIKDGSDSERFLYTLHDRCWLAGFGWWWISEGAQPLERSIIDRSVWASERLVFEGPPILGKGLRQDAESRRPMAYAGEVLDTRVACPPLTPAEQNSVDKMKADAKERLAPEIDKAHAAYIEKHAEQLVKRTGISKTEAIKTLESQCNGVLSEHVVLAFSDKKLKGCTVGDVLDDPKRFANKSLADPIEGVDYGRTTAMIMLRRDNHHPWIKSFAHGGVQSYTLVRKPGDELAADFPGRIPDYAKKPGTVVSRTESGIVVVPNWRERNRFGYPIPSMHNARLAIATLGVVCSCDTFHNKMLFGYRNAAAPHVLSVMLGEVTDNGIIRLRQVMSDNFGFDMKDAATRDAVISLALDHCFDPVRDMLDQAQGEYDGVKRLDRMAVTYFNCADTPLNRAIVRKTMIAAVRRARHPGCKFDNITVMESEEGWNKSTAWRVLAGDENFSDASILGHGTREVQEQLSEVWIHENAELAGMRKAEIETVKTFASRQSDDARPAYGHFLKKQKRHSIEVGTTNSDEYLQSQTGNRRFWPLKLLAPIDIELLKRDRLQLWGEAAKYEAAGESIVLDKKLWPKVGEEQEKRRVKDPWEDILNNISTHVMEKYMSREFAFAYLKKGDEVLTDATQIRYLSKDRSREEVASGDLLKFVLGVQVQHQTNAHNMRLATVMKRLGWEGDRVYLGKVERKGVEVRVRGYSRPISAAAAKDFDWTYDERAKKVVTKLDKPARWY